MRPSDPRVAGAFFPETCHRASLTRRQLLAGGTALLAASAIASGGARAGDYGTAVIRRYASLPDDPWAVCHGIRGMGRDFAMKSGGRAVDWLLETQRAAAVRRQRRARFPDPGGSPSEHVSQDAAGGRCAPRPRVYPRGQTADAARRAGGGPRAVQAEPGHRRRQRVAVEPDRLCAHGVAPARTV